MPNDSKESSVDKTKKQKTVEANTTLNLENASPEEINEFNYQKALNFMNCIKCMAASNDKKEMYQQAANQFASISDYKDANELSKKCKSLAKKTLEELNEKIYQRAQHMKSEAKRSQEYKSAAEEFRKISDYQDSGEMAAQCDQMSTKLENKEAVKRIGTLGAVIVIAIAIILGATTAHAKYYMGYLLLKTNSYPSAISMYKKLDGYKDSKNHLMEAEYNYGLELKHDHNYKGAAKAFAAAGEYKDSEVQRVEMEKLQIGNSQVGKIVKIGNCDWRILEIQDNQAFLMKRNALDEMPYNSKPGDVTWENSSLRKWLNSEFIQTAFSPAEQANIIQTKVINKDNSEYGTDGGNDTNDYAYLMSIDEVSQYQSAFPDFKNDSWLRTPGNSQSSAAFLSVDGSVMSYGYDTTGTGFKVRPVLWYNLQ